MEKLEDDLFFADLTRQISLLIMDDDEDPVATCPSVSLQAFSCAIHHPPAQPTSLYEQSRRRETKGTGVFIPQSSQPRRKHRQGRFASYNTKSHRSSQTDHHKRTVSQVSSDCAFRPKNG
ncbi:hypothetical protein PRUPE_1G153300 [Prunus persica]|uniref:Uncharacterized protein n=1 Tax=Prunus persica TaxID=3760 RepID=M5XMB2_PRUPE|nr:uncharacterized protein LOC18788610 [Prunus persica]ONI28652.1 hypothetical protein PRUPE_1G153300 [Prunus persica]ONI28653.1 hypothetical protein PRUPE_1G153300 [Prunus persica]